MIQAGELKIKVERDGPAHARVTIFKDAPPGHLPRKLVDLAVPLETFLAELRAGKVIE
jgi:hypothetical protein